MTDSNKISDTLSTPPLEKGSKDMDGYFFHWRPGNRASYIVQISKTKDSDRGSAFSIQRGGELRISTPVQTSVIFLHSYASGGNTYGVIYASPEETDDFRPEHPIDHPSNRVN